MKGNIIASTPNGQLVLHVTPVSWSWLVPGYVVEFCQEVRIVKEPPLPLPPVFCDPLAAQFSLRSPATITQTSCS